MTLIKPTGSNELDQLHVGINSYSSSSRFLKIWSNSHSKKARARPKGKTILPCFHIFVVASSCQDRRFLTGDQHPLKDGPEMQREKTKYFTLLVTPKA